MIYGFCHPGSGIGNQLHRYVATRVLAKKLGTDFSIIGPEFSKVKDFMPLDFGKPNDVGYRVESSAGKIIQVVNEKHLWEEKTNYYNPEFNFVPDETVIDGEFQDERYYEDYKKDLKKWLKVEPLTLPDDYCAIGFRGGEFALFPELFLPETYWEKAIGMLGELRYEVHTDDPHLAQQLFRDVPIIHRADYNWRAVRQAKTAIISNSSFYILPRLLKHWEDPEAITIAPRYWARHNTQEWSLPQNYYKEFTYI